MKIARVVVSIELSVFKSPGPMLELGAGAGYNSDFVVWGRGGDVSGLQSPL